MDLCNSLASEGNLRSWSRKKKPWEEPGVGLEPQGGIHSRKSFGNCWDSRWKLPEKMWEVWENSGSQERENPKILDSCGIMGELGIVGHPREFGDKSRLEAIKLPPGMGSPPFPDFLGNRESLEGEEPPFPKFHPFPKFRSSPKPGKRKKKKNGKSSPGGDGAELGFIRQRNPGGNCCWD